MTALLRSARLSADGPQSAVGSGRARTLWLAVAALAAAAFALQLRLGVYADPLWLMICSERWLDGQTAYVDFLENSPPAAILVYLPPVVVARALGVAREPLFVAYVLLVIGACLGLCARLLAAAWRAGRIGAPTLLGAAAMLLLVPDYAFGQRDHLALALALPLFVVFALRAEAVEVERWAAAAAGLAAALVCAIRPHYALAFALPLAYVVRRRGVRPLIVSPELYVGAGAGVFAAAASFVFFPRYFDTMLPIAAAAYVADNIGAAGLLLRPIAAAWAMLAAAVLVLRARAPANPFADVAALGAIGAAAVYLIQLKGYAYHGYFAVALMFVAATLLAADDLRRPGLWIFAPLAYGASFLAALGGFPVAPEAWEGLAAGLAVWALAAPAGLHRPALNARMASALACAALGLAAFAFHVEWLGAPPFEREARALGPHPKIALISDLGVLAQPLVSRVEGRWTQRVMSLLLTDHADRRLEQDSLDPDARRRVEALKTLDLEMFLSDMERSQPDAVIVEEAWAAKHFNDPRVSAFLGGYRRAASFLGTRGGDDPVAFYVRASR